MVTPPAPQGVAGGRPKYGRMAALVAFGVKDKLAKLNMDTLAAELRQAWNQITYLSLALIVSAWTIGVFGISCLVEEGDDDGAKKPPRRKQFLKTHVV